MGLPSGVKWSPYNIDVTKPYRFARSEFSYDCSYFSWGNVDGHNPTAADTFAPWSWGESNAQEPWYEGTVYGATPGSSLDDDVPLTHDAAAINCGDGWRIPTTAEFEELIQYSVFIDAAGVNIPAGRADKRITLNGIIGIYLKSTVNGNRLFFPCCGAGQSDALVNRGQSGYYWSSTYNDARIAFDFYFDGVTVRPRFANSRCLGMAIRPVKV